MRRVRFSLFITATALAGPAAAQAPNVHLDELTVETTRPAALLGGNISAGDGGSAATSGGGGGPSGITGYVARISPTATKTNTPLIETPQSVSVVTREQLNDRNVQSVNEALAYTPGSAANVFGFNPRFDGFFIRGFSATYDSIFRDGLRQSAVGLSIPRIDPYGTEALTILRGPVSGLYGLGSPGGIVDVTTKRPVFVPFGEIWFQAGNFDRFQGNFDLGGPVEGSDGALAYRLTGIVRQSDTFLPGATDDRVTIAPAFTWKPSADTTLTVLTDFQHTRLPGTAYFYNTPGFRVTRLYGGDEGFNDFKQDQHRIGYAFEHRVTPDLIVRQNFRYAGVALDFPYTEITSVTGLSASRYAGLFRETLSSVALDTQIEGHFLTGPVTHTVIGGVDDVHYDWTRRYGFDGNVPNLDLTGIRDYARFRYRTVIPRPPLTSGNRQGQDQVGLYLQEQATWDRFVLTLTGRHDWVSQSTTSDSKLVPGAPREQADTAFTYRFGLNYLLPGFVPYASYATTFTPQLGTSASGRAFRPATGDQIEAGVKFAIPNTIITGSVAGFDIVQSSILRQDPANPANSVATGSVESKGFEAEVTANFAPGTNLTLAFTHLDFRFLRQTSLVTNGPIDGNALSGLPGNTVTAFATHLFPPGSPLAGLQIGGGVRYAGTSFADDENTVRNPTVTVFDALVAYDFAAIDPKYQGVRAQINAYNILDRSYTNCQAGYCYRGAPATVIGSLIYRW